eukprot:Nk52_evm2s1569 gene=Nk52_evmTU2s1569
MSTHKESPAPKEEGNGFAFEVVSSSAGVELGLAGLSVDDDFHTVDIMGGYEPHDDFFNLVEESAQGVDPGEGGITGKGSKKGQGEVAAAIVQSNEWFHGRTSRKEAERIMRKSGQQPGSFLVRESARDPGDYTLTLRLNNKGVLHFKIIYELGDFYLAGRKFNTLNDLVANFTTVPLAKRTLLKYPVVNENAGARNQVIDSIRFVAVAKEDCVHNRSQGPSGGGDSNLYYFDIDRDGTNYDESSYYGSNSGSSRHYSAEVDDGVGSEGDDDDDDKNEKSNDFLKLDFKKGDKIDILDDVHPVWWWARIGEKKGFVRSNTVEPVKINDPTHLPLSAYLHRNVTREVAEALLKDDPCYQPGTFLVRTNEQQPDIYTLSLKVGVSSIRHFRMQFNQRTGKVVIGGRHYDRVEDVIKRYTVEPLYENLHLKFACYPKTTEEEQSGNHIDEGDNEKDRDVRDPNVEGIDSDINNSKPDNNTPGLHSISIEPIKSGKQLPLANKIGYLTLKSHKTKKWRRRFFVLVVKKKRLYYFENESSLKPKGIVDLSVSRIYYVHDSFFRRPNCFQIVIRDMLDQKFYVSCDTPQELRSWVWSMKRCILLKGDWKFSGREDEEVSGFQDPSRFSHSGSTSVANIKDIRFESIQVRKLSSKISSPYCIVCLGDIRMARTFVCKTENYSSNPEEVQLRWDDGFLLNDIPHSFTTVTIELYSRGSLFSKDILCALVTLNLEDLYSFQNDPSWYTLYEPVKDAEGTHGVYGEACGEIFLKYSLSNEIVLQLSEYNDLNKTLVSSSYETISQGLGGLGERDLLASSLLNIFTQSNKTVEYISTLVYSEIKTTKNVTELFRANSLATKTLDLFMKNDPVRYLHATLGKVCRDIGSSKYDLDVVRQKQNGPVEENKNSKYLIAYLNETWDSIYASRIYFPAPLKAILHSLRTCVEETFSEVAALSAISSFVFLRFFCMALLDPRLFNMTSDHPSKQSTRNLVIVAKALQVLANVSKHELILAEYSDDEGTNDGRLTKLLRPWYRQNCGKMVDFLRSISSIDTSSIAVIRSSTSSKGAGGTSALLEATEKIQSNVNIGPGLTGQDAGADMNTLQLAGANAHGDPSSEVITSPHAATISNPRASKLALSIDMARELAAIYKLCVRHKAELSKLCGKESKIPEYCKEELLSILNVVDTLTKKEVDIISKVDPTYQWNV